MTSFTQIIKQAIKRILQILAANLGRHTRQPKQAELLVLMYHRILPAQDPRSLLEEPGMMVTPETFRLHMSVIKPLFDTIHLSQWLELKNSGKKLPERACAITFDDGWADNYEFAYPILKDLDIPATIFLVSNMIGKNNTFWPERLACIITAIAKQPEKWSHASLQWVKNLPTSYAFETTNTSPPTAEQLSEIIHSTKTFSDNDICQKLDLIESELQLCNTQQTNALLNWQQVEEMSQSGLIEMGSHTCNHIRLTANQETNLLAQEIINSKQTIKEKTKQDVKVFCYPNGDYSDTAQTLVSQNYTGAVTTDSGWNTAESDSCLLQRIGVHEDISNDKTNFLARISGWL